MGEITQTAGVKIHFGNRFHEKYMQNYGTYCFFSVFLKTISRLFK